MSSSARTWRGIAAIVIGLITVAWPSITVETLVLLFAVYCFMSASNDAAWALRGKHAGPVVGHLLLAVVALAAGLTTLVVPDITALFLAAWIAGWAFVAGLLEIGFGFRSGLTPGNRARWIVSGLASTAFGLVLAVRPDIGVLALATLFGFYTIVHGASNVALAHGKTHPMPPPQDRAAPA